MVWTSQVTFLPNMLARILADDPTAWITPSTLASGGATVAVIAIVVLFVRHLSSRDTQLVEVQDKAMAALTDSRSKCDEAMKLMADRFTQQFDALVGRIVDSNSRVEKALDAIRGSGRGSQP